MFDSLVDPTMTFDALLPVASNWLAVMKVDLGVSTASADVEAVLGLSDGREDASASALQR